jgi:transaldolase
LVHSNGGPWGHFSAQKYITAIKKLVAKRLKDTVQMNYLSQLKAYTCVVADTGDVETIQHFHPDDATTNPSLVLKAVESGEYNHLLKQVVEWASVIDVPKREMIGHATDRLVVLLGCEIIKIIPGRVSTEIRADLSFDVDNSVIKARLLCGYYEEMGFSKNRVLIKLAATWEGIQAAKILEAEGINCNLTLVFNLTQAKACADAGVFLISPFVGRVLDWYKKEFPSVSYAEDQEPGVLFVNEVCNYYRQHQYKTLVMGASFRNIGEILALASCDRLTISPVLLRELEQSEGELSVPTSSLEFSNSVPTHTSVKQFRWGMNEDPMATEKLAEGIRIFNQDQGRLEAIIANMLP